MPTTAEHCQVSKPRPSATRKKFATPPVKNACLACRASRVRCDGKDVCTNCSNKGKECHYTRSKRGGPRVTRKKKLQAESENQPIEYDPSPNDTCFSQIPLLIDPGAGLRHLDFFQDSDYLFDSVFTAHYDQNSQNQGSVESTSADSSSEQFQPIVRLYGSDRDVLDAYYVFVHPYFPILPPPIFSPAVDRPLEAGASEPFNESSIVSDYEPSSPISLAISTILALVPHPSDPDPSSPESVLLRREHAQSFAQSTLESIEVESELLESTTAPSRALSGSSASIGREPFHPKAPIELESILALLILSIYEYAQRGNIAKMRSRAGQALISAMNISLHSLGSQDDDDGFAEARRRAWWMTYICVCQGSIVSCTPPTISIHDPRFTTKRPTISSDPDAWPVFLQAQQTIIAATQFIIELNKALQTNSSLSYVFERMQELDSIIEPLIARADTWVIGSPSTMSVDSSEAIVATGLKGIARIKLNSARIKLHRYCAFSDVPVFTEKHCDLKSSSQGSMAPEMPHQEPSNPSSCGCSSLFNRPSPTTADTSYSSSSSLSPSSTLSSVTSSSSAHPSDSSVSELSSPGDKFPFSSQISAKVCLKSALNIAQSFETLPYPNPTGIEHSGPSYLSPYSIVEAPRSMPGHMCCAMQSSYALLMLCHKTRAMNANDFTECPNDPLVNSLLSQLHHGLKVVVGALQNYSIAFEALGGMKEQIERALALAIPNAN